MAIWVDGNFNTAAPLLKSAPSCRTLHEANEAVLLHWHQPEPAVTIIVPSPKFAAESMNISSIGSLPGAASNRRRTLDPSSLLTARTTIACRQWYLRSQGGPDFLR
eukprot:CAMPEP_0171711884 /NCGR_PEP_ID=MMETSP0991-20121206/16853_1 /TAXON_ID=483369 /ORGANISM="non described non described, Strain CCMP2098" /LENGTH=105 /DNA_ID=CAMNT_0012302295 /DNA_START=23 /DNA_END=341 /DNA_ORIENTATION=-